MERTISKLRMEVNMIDSAIGTLKGFVRDRERDLAEARKELEDYTKTRQEYVQALDKLGDDTNDLEPRKAVE